VIIVAKENFVMMELPVNGDRSIISSISGLSEDIKISGSGDE